MERVLDTDRIVRANDCFRINDCRMRDLLSLCKRVEADESLQALAGEFHSLFFHTGTETSEAAQRLKEATVALGDAQAGFAALIIMSGLDHMADAYAQRGIPKPVLVDSLRDTTIWMDHYEERTGGTGLDEVGWVLNSLRGILFRLGRFQFFNRPYESKACIARRRSDGMPIAFFMRQETLRGDGQVDGTNGIFDEEGCWTSEFEITDKEISGNPLHPGGYAVRKELRLPLGEWELAVQPGGRMLDIHIPKDGKMEFEQCRDSILEAMRFFSKYFPEKPYQVIHLCTWFLDAQLQMLLQAESNIVRFQREFYLTPVLATDIGCYERVFGSGDYDIAKAPEDTSLRRAIKRFVLAGNRMRYNTGLILPEDMKRYGEAQYQTRAAKALEGMLEEV